MTSIVEQLKKSIPHCFISEYEDYITIPALRRFCDEHNIPQGSLRDDLLNNVFEFACKNDENRVLFSKWLNKVLKEGIKHIYFREIYFNDSVEKNILINPESAYNLLKDKFKCSEENIWNCKPTHSIDIHNFHIDAENNQVQNISFEFIVNLIQLSNNDKQVFIYPIFVDLDLINNLIICRAKSKNKIYRCTNELLTEEGLKVTTKDIIIDTAKIITSALNLSYSNTSISNTYFKNKLYNIFNLSTFTPASIQEQLKAHVSTIATISDELIKQYNIPDKFKSKLEKDILVSIEKCLSLDQLTPEMLQADREFYPVKTVATDDEKTRHSNISANSEPLQCKERYYDTKEAIHANKECDSLNLYFTKRQMPKYFSKGFNVSLEVNNGWCIMKFPQYVEEADIQNVLSRFRKT